MLVVGRLALEGLLLTVGRLVLVRAELPFTRAEEEPLAMLPLLVKLLRLLLDMARLMEPPLELPRLTLAT